MSSLSCFQGSRRALYRVFVSPLERHEALLTRQLLPLVHGHSAPAVRTPSPSFHQTRSFIASSQRFGTRPWTPRRPVRRQYDDSYGDAGRNEDQIGRFTTKDVYAKSGRDRLPQDYEIEDPKIMVLDNGVVDGPLPTRLVLDRLASTESIRMISPYVPADTKAGTPVEYAVCKVVNKKEEYERLREALHRRRMSKATVVKKKSLEMTWTISNGDLATKLRKLRGFLDRGMRVEVILGRKKARVEVDEAVATELLAKVRKKIESLSAKEWKPADGSLGRTMRIFLDGKPKEQRKTKDEEELGV